MKIRKAFPIDLTDVRASRNQGWWHGFQVNPRKVHMPVSYHNQGATCHFKSRILTGFPHQFHFFVIWEYFFRVFRFYPHDDRGRLGFLESLCLENATKNRKKSGKSFISFFVIFKSLFQRTFKTAHNVRHLLWNLSEPTFLIAPKNLPITFDFPTEVYSVVLFVGLCKPSCLFRQGLTWKSVRFCD